MMAATLSEWMNFLAMVAALAGSLSVSPMISSRGLPLMPPGLIDLVHRHFRHQLGGRADGRRRPRQGEKGPDLDGLFLVRSLGAARHEHYQGRGHENP